MKTSVIGMEGRIYGGNMGDWDGGRRRGVETSENEMEGGIDGGGTSVIGMGRRRGVETSVIPHPFRLIIMKSFYPHVTVVPRTIHYHNSFLDPRMLNPY